MRGISKFLFFSFKLTEKTLKYHTKWFKQRKHTFNFNFISLLCKSVRLSSCRTIDMHPFKIRYLIFEIMQIQSSYKVHLNTISCGELSDPLCNNVNRGLTLVWSVSFNTVFKLSSLFEVESLYIVHGMV